MLFWNRKLHPKYKGGYPEWIPPRFIAIVGCQHHFGSTIFKPGQRVKLTKDPENPHDSEAIKVELDPVGQVGYVANSVHTVPRGCCSAGRIYDSFAESIQGLVRFVAKELAIVELESTTG